MKTELKLTLNNLKSNIKRTLFTIISIMLCSILIFTTTILVSSIKNGIIEISEKEKNDYHVILKDLSNKDFEKIYIQKINSDYNDTEGYEVENWIVSDLDEIFIKVKCKNIMNFSSYIDNIVKK